ncbi:PREDICTED: protein stoned-B-like, partial [Rhagoletis zephyria]|uniref:protein stoned-B-like n=1 Tax=Rhagoletis zephyria TaxID=28612 RepID=UPI00081181DB
GGGDSPASPQTPLYDEDTSQPLEEFPARYTGDGWEMMLRHPAKKKLTANRYWKKVWVRFIPEGCILQLFNKREDVQPFQELPLQASYSLSEVCAQQYDQYGKIFTIKVQYIFYRERVGVRPGQIAKVMQGQIQSMGDFARLGMPVEHAPQVSELLKIGSLDWAEVKQLVTAVEEAMFRLAVHRDRALTYRTEEIQCVVQDELYVEQSKIGVIEKQLARVRVFFLAFLNGIPAIEVGVNDLRRQGKEVVGRHDILPVVTEEWIRVEAPEFHACVQSEVFEQSQVVKLIPPDACHFELMRFRIRPPKNRELPLQVSAYMNITASKMELKCDILVPGCISRKHGQIPCEEIAIRFHIPECWIYFFRVEKHFRMGAVHSTNRRSGKLKGFDRFLGTAANPEPQLIEVTAGQAKYEHAYHSIVWRIPRLPKDGQGAYTQQFMIVRLPLSSFDRIPETFYDYVHVEFHMPSTTVSHTTLRSISIAAGGGENPPEKFVRYNAKYEYKIALSITYDDSKPEPEYVAAVALNNGSVKSSSGGGGGGTSETAGQSSEDEDEAVVEAGAGAVAAAVEVAE